METSPDKPEQGLRWVFKKAYSLSLYLFSCLKEFWRVFPRAYDYLSRDFKRTSLEEVLEKQKQAVAEKMLSTGVGDEETRRLLLEKTKALTQAVANQATSKEKKALEEDRRNLTEKFLSKSIDALPSSDHTVLEFQKAKQSLDDFEKSVALASSSQTPIKKGKAAIGFLIVFLALGFLAGEKKEQGGTSNETNNEKVVSESRADNENARNMDAKFEALVFKVKVGMNRQQVEGILGPPDKVNQQDLGKLNPQKAGQTLNILTWGKEDGSIILGFTNGILTGGGTPGYDIEKGFQGKLPSDVTGSDRQKLKSALEGIGFRVDD
ncbi:MAG: hypothetical protein ACKOAU_12775 [Pirellula sp.]